MNMLKSKTELLFLFLVVHLGNWFYGDAYVPDVDESQVESWTVERRFKPSYDHFSVNMKPSPSFICYHQWCGKKFHASYSTVDGHRSCSCKCNRTGYTSFLPSIRRCINAREAARFAGCQKYYSKLDQPAVDLTREKPRNDQTFKFHNNKNCTLSASYFHDYEGFQSSWQHVADDFFSLEKNGATFSVKWQRDTCQKFAGRIIRLNISCGAPTHSRCFLFKALGSVIYSASSSVSSGSLLPSTCLSLSSSSSSSFSSSSLSSLSSSPSSSLSSSPSLAPVLSSMPWSPSSSSHLQLIKSSVASISSAKLSQSPTSEKTSSSEMLLLKPMSSYSTSNTLTMPSMEPSWVTPTSTAAFIKPGSKEGQKLMEEKGSGVLIGAAVGSTLLAGAVFLILLICWRKKRAIRESKKEKKLVEVGNPVYGISNDEFQMEKAKGNAQDGQQRYQYPSNTGQLQSVGETVYSNPDSNYDNCAVYQSLEKPTPGSPVYQSLEEQIPESSVYQSLNSDQEKPSGRTALKNVSLKQSTLPNPKSSASDQLNPRAAGLGCAPNPKERRDTKRALPNTYSAQKPTYNLRHEADAGQETTPDALYVELEGPTSGQDYETLNGDDQYLAPIETNAQIGFENPCVRKDQVYFELEGPDAQNGPEREPSDAQEPLYNMLEDPNEGKSPKVEPSDSSFDPLYNVLEEIDSDGSKKPEPPQGHDNPAYEETLDFCHPYATPQRPGAQTESVYEPLRKASTLDPYTA